MELNYRVTGISDVTPAVIGPQQDFSPMHNAIAASKLAKERQAAAQEAEKAAKVKKASEDALYNVGEVNDPDYQAELSGKGKEILDISTRAIAQGAVGNPEYEPTINRLKNDAATIKGKANAMIGTTNKAYIETNSLPAWVNKQAVNKKIYDAAHKKDKATGRLLWDEMDPNEINAAVEDHSYAVNDYDLFSETVKLLPSLTKEKESVFYTNNPNDGSIDSKGVKITGGEATFWKPIYDDKQQFVKWEPGVSNEAADALLESNPYVARRADYLLNEFIKAETAARQEKEPNKDPLIIETEINKGLNKQDWKREYVKTNAETFNKYTPKNETKTTSTFANPKGDSDKEFKAELFTNQTRTTVGYNGKENVKMDSDVPSEYRFSGTKMDRPFKVNTTKGYYEDNNKPLTVDERTGDNQANISRVFLQAYDLKTGKPVIGKTNSLIKQPNIAWKWAAGGTVEKEEWVGEGEDAKKKTVKKNVIIPYDEISNDLKSQYGFDLDSRPDSDISDLEIISQIKIANPKATPEQQLQIYKKLRGQ